MIPRQQFPYPFCDEIDLLDAKVQLIVSKAFSNRKGWVKRSWLIWPIEIIKRIRGIKLVNKPQIATPKLTLEEFQLIWNEILTIDSRKLYRQNLVSFIVMCATLSHDAISLFPEILNQCYEWPDRELTKVIQDQMTEAKMTKRK